VLETIAAIATPAGYGGVGIVRVSGKDVDAIVKGVVQRQLAPRYAHYTAFFDANDNSVDQGIAIRFPAPHSYTGENVVEFQCHGGPVVLQLILESVLKRGARLARAGEFTERAFLNDKMDLVQAESVIDLIHADSEHAARCAARSLQGEFSNHVNTLLKSLISLRMFVEAAIDFPDEDIEFIESERVREKLNAVRQQLLDIMNSAQQGVLLQEGMTVVIAGKPNAGKSSLLNCLSGRDSAIVTDIAGTTRDIVREKIHIDGLPLHIIDTAGLRETQDKVEQEGVLRARREMGKADVILLIVDAAAESDESITQLQAEVLQDVGQSIPLMVIRNKSDLVGRPEQTNVEQLCMSAKTGDGVDELKELLKQRVGYQAKTEGNFIARARHTEALQQAAECIFKGDQQLVQAQALELLAEELRLAQHALNTITGEFTSDDLLGTIFTQFCIGK